MRQVFAKIPQASFLLFLFTFVSSCITVSLVSDYDEITDKALNETHEQVTSFLVRLERTYETEEGKYNHHVGFYDDLKSNINVIKTRIIAFGGDKYITGQIQGLDSMVITMEKIHKEGFMNREEVVILENTFNSVFGAMIKYQAALKSREKYKNKE